MPTYDPGSGNFVMVDGQIVERDALRVAEAIKDYDPDLEILCLNPEEAGVNDAPFIICHRQSNGVLKRVFEAWALDDRVLDRIRLADGHRGNVIETLEKMEAKIQKDKDDRYKDIVGARNDVVQHVLKGRKSVYTFRDDTTGELVRIYDDRPSERV